MHQYVKLYLFSASSGLYSCPLAMTDGAAKLIMVRMNNAWAAVREGLINGYPHYECGRRVVKLVCVCPEMEGRLIY